MQIQGRSDRYLLVTVIALVLFGVLMIYSASSILGHTWYDDDKFFVKKQLFSVVLGFLAMWLMSAIDYRFWRRWAAWMLGVTFILLISVFFFSRGEINGAHRWITFGPLNFQPAELAKLTFIIYAAAWLSARREKIADIKETFLPYLVVLSLISVLVLKEPDFGTLSIILVAAVAVYFVSGLTWTQFALGAVVAGLALSIVLASPYRRARLTTFLNPDDQSQSGAHYHIDNISIAIGSGGLWGLGFGESKQKRLFLPEPHTDSIFAVITEELGFARASLLVLAFLFLVYRGILISSHVKDDFGRLIAVGIISWLAFQAFINLGSMLQLVPLVGVPLPFISYGGTNLIISLAAVGLLLNISQHVETGVVPSAKKRR